MTVRHATVIRRGAVAFASAVAKTEGCFGDRWWIDRRRASVGRSEGQGKNNQKKFHSYLLAARARRHVYESARDRALRARKSPSETQGQVRRGLRALVVKNALMKAKNLAKLIYRPL